MSKKVFVVGPGYVGRSIIDLLLDNGSYEISALVRREEAAQELRNAGITPIMGSLDDAEKIKQIASECDILFHTATSDHIPSAQALCDGVRARGAEGKQTIYLHQSGASILSDDSAGDVGDAKVYSDLAPADIDALADDAPHRATDLVLLKARREVGEKAKIFIFMPPIIYGTDPKFNRLSIQIPKMTRYAFEKGHAPVVGAGKGRWGSIHVLDLAKAYKVVLDWLEAKPDSSISNPYFFAESAEQTWGKVSDIIGKGVHAAGKIADPTPKIVPQEQWGDLYAEYTPMALACNSRCRADRLRAMGWKPTQKDLAEAFVDEDLPIMLKE